MALFAWDDPDASACEDVDVEDDMPEEVNDHVELPTVDKIELEGAQEAYANTFETDFDDDSVSVDARFKEQGLSCASTEETALPQEKRFRKNIDWSRNGSYCKMRQAWISRWIASRPEAWHLRADLRYGDKRALALNAFAMLGPEERRRQTPPDL